MTYNMIKMSILKYEYLKRNLIFFVFLKIIAIIILIWIDHPESNVCTYGRTNEYKNKVGSTLNICFKRYLAEYVGETEIDKEGLYNNSPNSLENNGTSNYDDYVSIYRNIRNRDSIKLKLYKTGYRHRHAKKKGLSKLDCYCEKKIFDKIDYIEKLSDKMRSDKKGFKKKILKKYGMGFIILTLIPALGLIYYILFGCGNDLRGVFGLCMDNGHYEDGKHKEGNGCTLLKKEGWETTIGGIALSNIIFSYTMIIVVLLFFIYILAKVIKYEKLKAGKGKMRINEYYRFCKDIF